MIWDSSDGRLRVALLGVSVGVLRCGVSADLPSFFLPSLPALYNASGGQKTAMGGSSECFSIERLAMWDDLVPSDQGNAEASTLGKGLVASPCPR